jgi:hypothetical protein
MVIRPPSQAEGAFDDLASSLRSSIGLFDRRSISSAATSFELPGEGSEDVVLNDRDMWEKNDFLSRWIAESDLLKQNPSLESTVKGSKKIENPYSDPTARVVVTKAGLHPLLRPWVEECHVMDFGSAQLSWPVYEPKRTLTFDSERDPKQVMQPNALISFSMLGSEMMMGRPPEPLLMAESVPPAPLPTVKGVALSVVRFEPELDPVEPLFFTAMLYSDRRFISEEWHYIPEWSAKYFQGIRQVDISDKVLIELPTALDNVYLIFILSHILTVDTNGPVNEYYASKGKKLKASAEKNIRKSWPKSNEVATAFAWTWLPLRDIVDRPSDELIACPKPINLSEPLTAVKLKTLLDDVKKPRSGKYDINLSLTAQAKTLVREAEAVSQGFHVVRLMDGHPAVPLLTFTNKLQVRLDQAVFRPPSDRKCRSIFARVALRDGHEEVVALRSRWTRETVSSGLTRCWFQAAKQTFFDELFVFDLPIPISKQLSILVEFFLASPEAATDRAAIGRSVLQLVQNDQFIAEGSYQVPVDYTARTSRPTDKVDPGNCLSLQITWESVFVTPDAPVTGFLDTFGRDARLIQSADPTYLVRHLFQLLDVILLAIPSNARGAIECLAFVTHKVEPFMKDQLATFLNMFVHNFALRDLCQQCHRQLFVGWAEFIANDKAPAAERSDLHIVDMLLHLLIKSLFLSTDREISAGFSKFLPLFGRRLASSPLPATKHLVHCYARFINLLFDIGLYTYAIQAMASQFRAFITAKNPFLALFIEHVL